MATKNATMKKAYLNAIKAARKGKCMIAHKSLKRAEKLHKKWVAAGRKMHQTRGTAEAVTIPYAVRDLCPSKKG